MLPDRELVGALADTFGEGVDGLLAGDAARVFEHEDEVVHLTCSFFFGPGVQVVGPRDDVGGEEAEMQRYSLVLPVEDDGPLDEGRGRGAAAAPADE